MKSTQVQSSQSGVVACSALAQARLAQASFRVAVWSGAVQSRARRLARASGRTVGYAIQSGRAVPFQRFLGGLHIAGRFIGWAGQVERNLTTRCTGPGRGVASRIARCGEHRCTVFSSGTLVARSGELQR